MSSCNELEANFEHLINSLSKESGFELIYKNKEQSWREVCEILSSYHSDYQWLNLCYQDAYFQAELEASIVFFWQQKAIAVWPLLVLNNDGNMTLTSLGGSIAEPLMAPSVPLKTQKKLIATCFDLLHNFSEMYSCNNEYRINSSDCGLSLWGQKVFDKSKDVEAIKIGYVDLSLSIEDIKSKFRKSYRSLISAGLKKWQVDVQDVPTDDFDAFHQLHINVSGRETRSDATWDLQKQMISEKSAFLVLLKDGREIIGGGVFSYNHSHCYYGVGVYRRDYFPQALGHVVQFKAIEYMKHLGVRWYEIGELFTEMNTADEKLKSIANFKSGFSTHQFVRLILKA